MTMKLLITMKKVRDQFKLIMVKLRKSAATLTHKADRGKGGLTGARGADWGKGGINEE